MLLKYNKKLEDFIKNNLKLVVNCAKRYLDNGLPFEDLIQAGNVGLLTAFEKFDTERGNLRFAINKKITTFAIAKFKQSQWKIL